MDFRPDFVDGVGNTPLFKLRKASELTGCTILGKAEFLNPGGSVKDRAAKYMVLDAEQRNVIEPGGLIVEGTAGNTGIGLAMVGNSRGYRTLILMPNTQSQEKKDALRLCGAELREVPAVPYQGSEQLRARRETHGRGARRDGAAWSAIRESVGQPREPRRACREHGPGDLGADRRRVDGFICAVGTGGTFAGVGAYLKQKNRTSSLQPRIRWAPRSTAGSRPAS